MDEKELTRFVNWLVQSEEAPKGASFEETISWINDLATSKDGQRVLNKLIQTYKNKEMGIFKDGGKLNHLLCLKSGGKSPDCGCNKVTKHQETSVLPRQRGTADAYKGDVTPDYYGNESQWTRHKYNPAINVFDGADLHQTVITEGQYGVPRRSRRIITNYATPEKSDTAYVDATGHYAPKHPGFLEQIGLRRSHSQKYMKAVDDALQGFEPKYLSEGEIPKHQGGDVIQEPKYRDYGIRYSYPNGVERTESQESVKYPGNGTITRWITSENGQPKDTTVTVNRVPVNKEDWDWQIINDEIDRQKNKNKKLQSGGPIYRWNTGDDLSKGGFYRAEPMQFRGEQVSRYGYADPGDISAHGDRRVYSYGDYTVDDDKYGRSIYHDGVVYSDSERPAYWIVDGKSAPVRPTADLSFRAKTEIDMLDRVLGLPPGENSLYRKPSLEKKLPVNAGTKIGTKLQGGGIVETSQIPNGTFKTISGNWNPETRKRQPWVTEQIETPNGVIIGRTITDPGTAQADTVARVIRPTDPANFDPNSYYETTAGADYNDINKYVDYFKKRVK